jgi:hypothetical protein
MEYCITKSQIILEGKVVLENDTVMFLVGPSNHACPQFYEDISGWFYSVQGHGQTSIKVLRLCFQKCKEYGISLNPNKCAFMVFSRMILGFIISKEEKLPNPKKIQAIVNMSPPKNPHQIQVFNGMA